MCVKRLSNKGGPRVSYVQFKVCAINVKVTTQLKEQTLSSVILVCTKLCCLRSFSIKLSFLKTHPYFVAFHERVMDTTHTVKDNQAAKRGSARTLLKMKKNFL